MGDKMKEKRVDNVWATVLTLVSVLAVSLLLIGALGIFYLHKEHKEELQTKHYITLHLDDEQTMVYEYRPALDDFNPLAPTIEGKLFKGWFLDEERRLYPLTSQNAHAVTDGSIIYAKYVNVYTLTLYNIFPNSTQTLEYTIEENKSVTNKMLGIASVEKWSFGGWYTDVFLGDRIDYSLIYNRPVTSDISLYGKWEREKVKLTHMLNGGTYANSSTPLNTEKYEVDIPIDYFATIPDQTKLQKEKNRFVGWYTTNTYTTLFDFSKQKISTPTSVYAKWIELVDISFIITLQGESVSHTITIDKNTVVGGNYIPNLSRTGYSFEGWFLEDSYDTEFDISQEIEEDTVLYAKFDIVDYTVKYYLDSDAELVDLQNSYTMLKGIDSLPSPTRNGFEFIDWYSNADYTGVPVTSIGVGQIGDRKLYAQWEAISYTISYTENKGTMPEVYPINYTTLYTETLPVPTRVGYSFDGWYTTGDLSGDSLTHIMNGSYGNKELHAKWTPIIYTITYHLSGDTVFTDPGSVVYSYTVENEIILPGVSGSSTFLGWYNNEEGTGEALTGIEANTIGDKEFWAIFKK